MKKNHTRIALVLTALALMTLGLAGRSTHATSSTPYAGEASLDCSGFTLTPNSQSFSSAAGTATFHVDTNDDCSWNALSLVDWIRVDSSPRSGDGTVSYAVAANLWRSSEESVVAPFRRPETMRITL
jgi:hypothetical protein